MSTLKEKLIARIVDDANQGRENARSVISPEDIMTAKRDHRYDIEAIPEQQEDIEYHPELMINGAQILVNQDNATFEFVFNDDRTEVKKFLVTLYDDTKKLSNLFTCVPSGLIKKNITGIGATTLELKALRNSIIVMPTRNLAYEKHKSNNKDSKRVAPSLYVGGAVGDINTSTNDLEIAAYLLDQNIKYKKIIVVADSLSKVMNTLHRLFPDKADHARYFLMIDEIDMYQSEATYREALEKVIDQFLDHPHYMRALVSATVRPFSNPELRDLPIIELNYVIPKKREIILMPTNNPHLMAKEHIGCYLEETSDYIVVAYNNITGILKIINALPPEFQDHCSILCSHDNREKAGRFYKNGLVDAQLPSRVTFLTSTYFTGIDIGHRFRLYSISTCDRNYTMLSPERLKQIAGRCRHPQGLIEEHILYRTREIPEDFDFEEFIENTLKLAEDVSSVMKLTPQLPDKHSELRNPLLNEYLDAIINRTSKKLDGQPVNIVRINIFKELVPAYLNIDALIEYYRVRFRIYSDPLILKRLIERTENLQDYIPAYPPKDEEQEDAEAEVEQNIIENAQKSARELIDPLKGLIKNNKLQTDADIHRWIYSKYALRSQRKLLKRYAILYKYVPYSPLLKTLADNNDKNNKWFQGFSNSCKIWAMSPKHRFKKDIRREFKIGTSYSRERALRKMGGIADFHFPKKDANGRIIREETFTDRQLIALMNECCEVERMNSGGKTTYKILSFNPQKITGKKPNEIADSIPTMEVIKIV